MATVPPPSTRPARRTGATSAATPVTVVRLPPGPFLAQDAAALRASCDRWAAEGVAALHLDVGAVTACDASGSACWLALAQGASGPAVTVEGARWSQFLELLRDTPVDRLADVCDQVRRLVPPARRTGSAS